jgi:hypothetical protein
LCRQSKWWSSFVRDCILSWWYTACFVSARLVDNTATAIIESTSIAIRTLTKAEPFLLVIITIPPYIGDRFSIW